MLRDEEARSVLAGVFLVRDEREDDVARRCGAVARESARDGQHHRVHVLHVERAATETEPSRTSPPNGIEAPVRRDGGYDVEMAVHEQRGRAAVDARDANDGATRAPGSDSSTTGS